MSVVYFIQRAQDGAVKIGFSTNLMSRFQTLAQEFPDIRLLGWVAGTQAAENRLHNKFRHLRFEGEWFISDKTLLDWINKNACPLHHEKWAERLYDNWLNEKQAMEKYNQALQLKFDMLVALDTKDSIRHAPLDPQTHAKLRLIKATNRVIKARERLAS